MRQDRPALCIVGPLPPPAGGMANQCEQLARLLKQEGWVVDVVRTNTGVSPAWIGTVPMLRAACRLPPYLLALWRAAGRAAVMHVFANSGKAWHLLAAPAVWVARLRGVPVVINYRGGNAADFFARAPRIVHRTLRMAKACVTPSAFLQRVFRAHGMDATVVPNIVDLSRFPPRPRRDFGDAPNLIVTRHLEAIYDIGTAIQAFALVRAQYGRARLTVAGTGPEREPLEALVGRLGLGDAVHFVGQVQNADIAALYADADLMLNPSTVDNMPISILEAFASGVPVVSTRAGGIPDMVDDGVSALLVDVGDAAALADAALRVLRDEALAAALRQGGLEAARAHDWPSVREQWMAVYRRLAPAGVTP